MLAAPSCHGINKDGAPCRAARMRDGDFCFWHSPEHAAEAEEARRLGGLRRRKEATIQGAYELEGLDAVHEARRWIEIAAVDTLALQNSIARSRTLAYLAGMALRAYQQTEQSDPAAGSGRGDEIKRLGRDVTRGGRRDE